MSCCQNLGGFSVNITKLMSVIAVSLSAVALSACVGDYPTDLRLTDLRLVEKEKTSTFRKNQTNNLSYKENIILLEARFSTKVDIWKYLNTEHYILHVDSYFCNRPNYKVLIDFNRLFWRDIDIAESRLESVSPIEADASGSIVFYKSASPIKPDASGLITYSTHLDFDSEFVLGYKNESSTKFDSEYEFRPYDLVEDPEDVCLQIVARSMVAGSKSNVVKIPKNLIRSELRKLDILQKKDKKKSSD